MNTLRVGVIGAGQAGGRHVAAYVQIPCVRVMYVVEPDDARGSSLAAQADAGHLAVPTKTFWEHIDAVSVCVPHALLAEYALTAIAHGKHVLLEKPMALTLADADAIIAAAKRASRVDLGAVYRGGAPSCTAASMA